MSAKEELHDVVDQLSDERATEALAYLRRLLADDEIHEDNMPAEPGNGIRFGPVPASVFLEQTTDLETLLQQQGVQPITDMSVLYGDFWPEDETTEEFLATIRRWRDEGDDD